MDRFLVQTLMNVGFNEKESRVLLASFSLGKATAGDIAKRAELKRAIVYVILEDLAKQGYMTRFPTRGVKTYQAIPPEKLLHLRQQQVENFRFMLPLILSHKSSASSIEFHDTIEGALAASHTFGRAKCARYITNYASIRQSYGEAVMKKWADSSHNPRQKTRVQQIVVDEPDGRKFASWIAGSPTWKLRYLPPEVHSAINFDVVDDTVAVTSFEPFSMVLIHSKEVARLFELLFDQTWEQCKRQTTRKKQG